MGMTSYTTEVSTSIVFSQKKALLVPNIDRQEEEVFNGRMNSEEVDLILTWLCSSQIPGLYLYSQKQSVGMVEEKKLRGEKT